MTLPYPEPDGTHTGGWSGSDASHDRARREAADGTAAARQAQAAALVTAAGYVGATWKELADRTNWHHGQVSGALSNLHKAGRIARLTDTRGRCSVYVAPEFVDGRDTKPQGRRKPDADPEPEPATVASDDADDLEQRVANLHVLLAAVVDMLGGEVTVSKDRLAHTHRYGIRARYTSAGPVVHLTTTTED